jgi:lactoylglutathione lyase
MRWDVLGTDQTARPPQEAFMSTLKITAIVGSLLFAISAMTFANRPADSRSDGVGDDAKTAKPSKQTRTATDPEQGNQEKGNRKPMGEDKMQFGNFSVSLAVRDIRASKAFYEKLDFVQVFGKLEQRFVIMQNGTTTIGLFQGMFDKNILTFNPGWNHKMETLKRFHDVRELQATIKERGITPVKAANAATNGPASFVMVDPDGNSILVDQHVPKSK